MAKKKQQLEGLEFKTFQSPNALKEWANGPNGTEYIISIDYETVDNLWYCWYIIE